MPYRNLNNNDTITTISQWLDLNMAGPIVPIAASLNLVPATKGLYFWYMSPNGYTELSDHVQITAIEPRIVKVIEGMKYDLVYLGTAGVRNNKNEINKGTLLQRMNWHIVDNKDKKAVCNGRMSTFRRTVASVLSNDLLADGTQEKLDLLFKKYFRVFYITYAGPFAVVRRPITNAESLLINKVRPLFNIKNNPNALNRTHLTWKVKIRRNEIEKISKIRLGCNSGPSKTKTKDKLNPNPGDGPLFVYFNIPNKSVTIHQASCGHCNNGRGKLNKKLGTKNGDWLGPFSAYSRAKDKATKKAAELGTEPKDCRCVRSFAVNI